jgi:hypothetical protein
MVFIPLVVITPPRNTVLVRKDSIRSRINLRHHSGRSTTGNNSSITGFRDGSIR